MYENYRRYKLNTNPKYLNIFKGPKYFKYINIIDFSFIF